MTEIDINPDEVRYIIPDKRCKDILLGHTKDGRELSIKGKIVDKLQDGYTEVPAKFPPDIKYIKLRGTKWKN